jgi:hypothetical protein
MCYWVLPSSGIPIARTTIQALTQEELGSETCQGQIEQLDNKIKEKFRSDEIAETISDFKLYRADEDPEEYEYEQSPMDDQAISPDVENVEEDSYDELLMTVPIIQRDGQTLRAKIIGRKRDTNGDVIGTYNPNPILNTRIYLAEFPDGHIQELSTNTVIESIYSQIDDKGYDNTLFQDIKEHRRVKTMIDHLNDRLCTTSGWEICISWQDGSTLWHPLSDVKNSFQLQMAEYAKDNKLENEPAFSWWVNHTLKKKKRLIKSTKTRCAKWPHKFSIYIPRTVEEALKIDKDTNTSHWRNAIHEEMTNNRKAFQFQEENEKVPIGYKWIRCHMIFDVKMDFTRKAHFVAGGHMMNPPDSITYSSIVSRDSVRIAFLLAVLNDVNILSTDIGNAYLNAKPREKVYTTAGPEFGAELQGRPVLIVRALYGLKTSGAAWRAHLANTLNLLGYNLCLTDPDVWFHPARKTDGFEYYEYVLVYVDDLLVLFHQGEKTMKAPQDF